MKKLKTFFLLIIVLLLSSNISFSNDDEPVGEKVEGGILYGTELKNDLTMVSYDNLIPSAIQYDGQEIIVEGKVNEVCQNSGCWFTFGEGKENVRVMTKHEFFIPKDASGKNVKVAGIFKITEISKETAEHYNSESQNPVDPSEITGPQTAFILEATGIVILD
ncbi:MAG: DUF4920 domain-containing protein [Ignavibacteriaceae bacterium]|jgi:hypothetical protein|nr:MAG: DUF4920 domain-containing protein [Chlorobiota bacterium]KXK02476.1 MAG: hypothetical protein UZ04_CHB001001771 [Chlorobi bacterium OLB4]MBV6398072.1 hypothetical protein [Ignavibacteria bacterium]MCC6886521.1 DUF4920 domain-containing protein [Ignavibacteriales bacterium]MCE7952403.1 DUF4920 domain-containing protein [Chlorobi bacterium CHB7]MDL1886520.1 DUF4920 domain-containing protein [Ignavibacteria bacterium CHB1]MEB2329761.1 DUF4920 domain-containing protein [Ignavibacteriaceae